MEPTPEWMTLTRTFSVDMRTSESASTSTEPCTSPLRIRFEILHAGLLDLFGETFERDAGALGELRLALLHLAVLSDALGLVAVGHDQERVASIRHAFEAEHFDRSRWTGFGDAGGRDRRTWRGPCRRYCRRYSCRRAQSSVLDEDGGDGAAAAIELGFDALSRRPCGRASPSEP